ncbi:hypothetical protein, partial [Bradyrhizobium sp.]
SLPLQLNGGFHLTFSAPSVTSGAWSRRMFELAVLTAICCIATATSVTIYQRRQDVLYGPYIERSCRQPSPQDRGIEGEAS